MQGLLVLFNEWDIAVKIPQAECRAYIGKPYSLEGCPARTQALMQLYCALKPRRGICYTLTVDIITTRKACSFASSLALPLLRSCCPVNASTIDSRHRYTYFFQSLRRGMFTSSLIETFALIWVRPWSAWTVSCTGHTLLHSFRFGHKDIQGALQTEDPQCYMLLDNFSERMCKWLLLNMLQPI